MSNPAQSILQDSRERRDLKHFKCRVRLRNQPQVVSDITLNAPNLETVLQNLWDQGYLVITVKEHERRGAGHSGFRRFLGPLAAVFLGSVPVSEGEPSGFSWSFFQHISNRELIFFAVQLATLLKAGVPLIRSLDVIHRGAGNPAFRVSIAALKSKIGSGSSFHQALRAQGKVFPWIWVNMVEVGESTGKLPECLEEIARYQEAAARIRSKVITALFYPGVLTLAVISALGFLLVFIVPKFVAIFEAQNIPIPLITQFVIGVSNLIRFQFTPVAIGILLLVTGAIYYGKRPKGKLFFDALWLGAPVFGPLILQVAVVRFCRSLGTLLRSGVQILEALGISGRLLQNHYLESKIYQVSESVRSGQGLGAQLEAKHIFPEFMTQLLIIGEESGQLERFLDLLANYYEEQVDTFLSRLTVLLEPILLVFMGGVIGTIVISMFLPIVELSTRSGMGG